MSAAAMVSEVAPENLGAGLEKLVSPFVGYFGASKVFKCSCKVDSCSVFVCTRFKSTCFAVEAEAIVFASWISAMVGK
jgi:hypothetical protein